MPPVTHKAGVVTPAGCRVGPDRREEDPEDEGGGAELGQLIETAEKELLADGRVGAHQEGDDRLDHHRGDGEHLCKVADIGPAAGS